MPASLYKKIFLAEDDEDDFLMFERNLKNIDNSIILEHATDGASALKKLASMDILPEIIFLDINMPCMNGFEFMNSLKSDQRTQHIPTVIFTGSSNPSDVEKTHKLGADIFLLKPIEDNLLVEKLKRILSFDFANKDGHEIIQYSV